MISFLASPAFGAINASVVAYGATGNGYTDDTVAIVNASNAVAAQGGTLNVPAGVYIFDPTRGHIALGSNVTISGPGTIRVKAGVGNFDYVIGPTPAYANISNVLIQGLVLDENVLNNPSTVQQDNAALSQDAIRAYNLTGLTVDGVTLYTSGVNTIVSYDYLTVKNSRFNFQSRANNIWFDNSTIYLPTNNSTCSITNNFFDGGTSHGSQTANVAAANTAIEIHYSKSCTIAYNNFNNYVTAVLPMDPSNLTINNNTITNAQYAVSIWSLSLVQNVTVSHNSIYLNNKDRASIASAGVALYWCSYCTPVGNFSKINIISNYIEFQPEINANVAASSHWGIGIMPAGSVDQVLISGNTVVNAPIRGIAIGNAFTNNLVSNIMVQYNSIVSAGNNTANWWYESAIALQGNLQSVRVIGNVIQNSALPFVGHYAFWSDPAGTYNGVDITGNIVDSVYQTDVSPRIRNN